MSGGRRVVSEEQLFQIHGDPYVFYGNSIQVVHLVLNDSLLVAECRQHGLISARVTL